MSKLNAIYTLQASVSSQPLSDPLESESSSLLSRAQEIAASSHPSALEVPRRTNAPDPTTVRRAALPAETVLLRQRMECLKGAFIHPTVADVITGFENGQKSQVTFDGFGRITGFDVPTLPLELIEKLETSTIEPLTTSNARIPREAARPERDLLIRAMYILGFYREEINVQLRDEAKSLFLSGSFNHKAVSDFFDRGAERLGHWGDVLMQDQFKKLAMEARKPVTVAQLADNIYGRTFESILSENLVQEPPGAVLQAARELGNGILRTLASFSRNMQNDILYEMTCAISEDKRPWFDSSEFQSFLVMPSMKALSNCLTEVTTGFDCIKMPYIGVKMALSIIDVSISASIDLPAWLSRADDFYSKFLNLQKPAEKAFLRNSALPLHPGNWLHYHPKISTGKTHANKGRSWTDDRVIALDKLSPFEKAALSSGQTVVCGPSGSTSLMAFFGRHLASEDPRFPQCGHALNTLMFAVFDGGHSTSEVLATLDAISAWERGASPAHGLTQFLGGYAAIAELADSPDERHALRKRVDDAVNRAVEYFAEKVA